MSNKALDGLDLDTTEHEYYRNIIERKDEILKQSKIEKTALNETEIQDNTKLERISYDYRVLNTKEYQKIFKYNEVKFKNFLIRHQQNWPYFLPEHVSPTIRKFSDDFFESLEKFERIKTERRTLFEIMENESGHYIQSGPTTYKIKSMKSVEGPNFLCYEYYDPSITLEVRKNETPKDANAFKTYFHDWVNIEDHVAYSPIILGDRRKTTLKEGNYRFALINYYNVNIDKSKNFKNVCLWKGNDVHFYLIDKELADKINHLLSQVEKSVGIPRDDRNHLL